jgi:oligopeptide/dipeptide ABC transporter ATP-binding protein
MTFSLLRIRHLSVKLKDRSGFLFRRRLLYAVRDVSLDIETNQTFCLLGESGSGKTTLAWSILGPHPFHGGSIVFHGSHIKKSNDAVHQKLRSSAQMVFQNPAASLDPHFPLWRSIAEPLVAKGIGKQARSAMVRDLAINTGLSPDLLQRRPSEVSGGQNQRACLARALSTRPAFLILDEPLSALDAIAQHQLVDLLCRIKERFRLTYFLITHDMALAKQIGTVVAVMYLGTIVEKAPAQAFFSNPCHPYAKALLSSALTPGLWQGPRIILQGEIPSMQAPPSGCVFHPRCPSKMAVCDKVPPEEISVGEGHAVVCHLFAKTAGKGN